MLDVTVKYDTLFFEKGVTSASQQDNEPVQIPSNQVIKHKIDPDDEVKDGDW